jgi:hypothetical protein
MSIRWDILKEFTFERKNKVSIFLIFHFKLHRQEREREDKQQCLSFSITHVILTEHFGGFFSSSSYRVCLTTYIKIERREREKKNRAKCFFILTIEFLLHLNRFIFERFILTYIIIICRHLKSSSLLQEQQYSSYLMAMSLRTERSEEEKKRTNSCWISVVTIRSFHFYICSNRKFYFC